jgi:hypothetical protein
MMEALEQLVVELRASAEIEKFSAGLTGEEPGPGPALE